MPQLLLRSDPMAVALFQLLELGEPPLRLARPDRLVREAHVEDTPRPGAQRHGTDLPFESRQALLRRPGGAQEPAALRAIYDLKARAADGRLRSRPPHRFDQLRKRAGPGELVQGHP